MKRLAIWAYDAMAGHSFIIALMVDLQLRYNIVKTSYTSKLHLELDHMIPSRDRCAFVSSSSVFCPKKPSFGCFGLELSLDGMATWWSGTPEHPSPPSLKWASSLVPKFMGKIKGLYLVEFGYLMSMP